MSYDPDTGENRTRYFVSWFGFVWHFRREGRVAIESFRTKREAIDYARHTLRYQWEHHGEKSELNIRNMIGVIREKDSYGQDPPRTKG